MATFYQCLRGDSSELHIRATGIMDAKLREAEAVAEDSSGKKKSKFKSFKKFFVKKKQKETLPSLAKSGLKPSQSTSDVTTHESMHMDDDSEDETGSLTGILGSRALSHESIFIPDIVQEPARPGRVFSQENVSDRIKTLQLKLQHNIVIGPPPLRIPAKRMDDAGTSSEDDGLPRSPPEISLLQDAIHPSTATRFSDSYKRLSSLSLAGTGSEEEEQISSGPSSRPLSPVSQPLPRLSGTRTISLQRSDSLISPSADFTSPPQFSTCLDNSAAKHRLSVKPRNQRMSKTRKPSVKSSSESLNDLSCTPEEDEGDRKEALEEQAQESIGSTQQAVGDTTQTVSNMPGTHGLGMPQVSSYSSRDAEVMFPAAAEEKAASDNVWRVNLEEPYGQQNKPCGTVTLESEEHVQSLRLDLDDDAQGEKDPSKARGVFSENMPGDAIVTLKPERKPLPHVSSVSDSSPTKDTPGTHSLLSSVTERSTVVAAKALLEASHVEGARTVRPTSAVMSDFGRPFPRRSYRNHSDHSLHANKAHFPITQPTSPSSSTVESTYHPPEKSKSDQALPSSNKESSQSVGHSGNVSEKKVNVANEPVTLRKFSVSSARERPRTGSFNMKGNPDRESQLSVKFPLTAFNLSVSRSEKHKGDAEAVSEHQERKACTKKQEPLLDAEPRPEEKVSPGNVSQAPTTVASSNHSLVTSQCPSDSEERSPFQVKLRPTSLSLRYRGGSSPEPKGAKRYSAEFKVEKEQSTPVSKDDHPQIKKADVSVGSLLNEHGKSKSKSSENVNEKPPLPRKPALQNKTASISNANTENQETKPTDSRAEIKEFEKRPSFHKFSEKGMLSPVIAAESMKGTDSQPEPTWITLAKQKQWGLQEQQLNIEDKLTAKEVKVEAGLQDKNKESVEVALKPPADAILNKTSPCASKAAPEKPSQEAKNELKESRQRAHTLSHPVCVTQSSLPAEKEEKIQPLQANPTGSDRPSWMELAKKKSQAWNDMPQIIK